MWFWNRDNKQLPCMGGRSHLKRIVTNNKKGAFLCCLISIIDEINVIDMKSVVANLLHVLRNRAPAMACYRVLCNGFKHGCNISQHLNFYYVMYDTYPVRYLSVTVFVAPPQQKTVTMHVTLPGFMRRIISMI